MSGFWQRLVGLFSPPHGAYSRAYDLYEGYVWRIGLGLKTPTAEQVKAARDSTELVEAEGLYQKALKLCHERGLNYNEAAVMYQLGLLQRLWGYPDRAIPLFEEARERFERVVRENPRARVSISMCHFYLGQMMLAAGRVDEGRTQLETAIALDTAMGDERRIVAARELLGG